MARLRFVLVLVNAACVVAGIYLLSQPRLSANQLAAGLGLLTFAAGQHTPRPRISVPPPPPPGGDE